MIELAPFCRHLDWPALTLGLIGTALWAHNGRLAKHAAAWWLASSLLWMTYAYSNGLPALGARDLTSVALYLYGGYRWLFSGRSTSNSESAHLNATHTSNS